MSLAAHRGPVLRVCADAGHDCCGRFGSDPLVMRPVRKLATSLTTRPAGWRQVLNVLLVFLPPWNRRCRRRPGWLGSGVRTAGRSGPADTRPPVAPTGVLPSSVRAPPGAITQREMVPDPVLTVNRNRPCWVIPTQHGAVCRRRTGRSPATICRRPSPGTPRLCRCQRCARWTQTADPGSWGRNSLPNGPRLWAAAWAPSAAVCACSNDRTYRVGHC